MDLREYPTIDEQKAIVEQAHAVLFAIMKPAGVENKILRMVGEMVGQAYLQGWIERDRITSKGELNE